MPIGLIKPTSESIKPRGLIWRKGKDCILNFLRIRQSSKDFIGFSSHQRRHQVQEEGFTNGGRRLVIMLQGREVIYCISLNLMKRIESLRSMLNLGNAIFDLSKFWVLVKLFCIPISRAEPAIARFEPPHIFLLSQACVVCLEHFYFFLEVHLLHFIVFYLSLLFCKIVFCCFDI